MSVINSVLKDLDKRASHFTPIDIGSVTTAAPTSRDHRPYIVALLLLLVAIAAAGYYLHQNQPGFSAAPEPVVVAVPTPTPVTASVSAAAPVAAPIERSPANQIVDLQISESEQEMRLEFALSERAVAFLKQRSENSFGYHLRDIESRIDAPRLENNPWINSLAITAVDAGVDIGFETAEDILVETRQTVSGGEPVWTVTLRRAITQASPVAAVEPAPTPAPVPKPVAAKPVATQSPVAAVEQSEPADILAPAPQAPAETAADTETGSGTPTEAVAGSDATSPGGVKLEIRSTDPDAVSANQLSYALDLMRKGRLADAEALLQRLLGGAEDRGARRNLLALYSRQQMDERFQRLLLESMTRYPDDLQFRTEFARLQFQAGAYREVIRSLSDAGPLDADRQALIAASYQRLDDHVNAITHYELALKQDFTNARNWIGLGISQEHSAALREALQSYQNAARLGQLTPSLQAFVSRRSVALARVLN